MLTEARARTAAGVADALRCVVTRPLPRAVVTIVMSLNLSACSTGYLLQAARGQWQLLRQRQPIERVIEDARTEEAVKARLRIVREARDFASAELALPDNPSYRSYAALGRPYVVWNVIAAPEFSVEPKRWCFPITGCIAYRGYFRERNARRYAETLRGQGFDVAVAGVAAYSTLGRFADPVLDTMMRYGELELVGTMFHELAHQLVYVKNDSEFNEAFAMTVEQEGVARWLAAHDRSSELNGYRERREQQRGVVSRFAAGRRRLDALYRESLAPGPRRARKQQLLGEIGDDVRGYERGLGIRSGYDAWLDEGLNNAHLASVATYFDCVPGFQRLLATQRGELTRFYAEVRALGRGPASARRALCAGP
jgi:predicted aminopeptidase